MHTTPTISAQDKIKYIENCFNSCITTTSLWPAKVFVEQIGTTTSVYGNKYIINFVCEKYLNLHKVVYSDPDNHGIGNHRLSIFSFKSLDDLYAAIQQLDFGKIRAEIVENNIVDTTNPFNIYVTSTFWSQNIPSTTNCSNVVAEPPAPTTFNTSSQNSTAQQSSTSSVASSSSSSLATSLANIPLPPAPTTTISKPEPPIPLPSNQESSTSSTSQNPFLGFGRTTTW